MNDIPFLDRFGDAMESAITQKRSSRVWAPWLRARMTIRAATAGAIAAGLVALFVVVNSFDGSPTSVLADWTPAPGVVEPAVVAVAENNCGVRPSFQINPDGSRQPIVLPPPAIVDQRGNAAAAMLIGGDTVYLCFLTEDGRGWDRSARSVTGVGNLGAFMPPLTVDVLVGSRISAPASAGGYEFTGDGVLVRHFFGPGTEVTAVAGRVSSEVTGIKVIRGDGPVVEASIENGSFLAWWPEETNPITMTVVAYGEGGSEVARWSTSPE